VLCFDAKQNTRFDLLLQEKVMIQVRTMMSLKNEAE